MGLTEKIYGLNQQEKSKQLSSSPDSRHGNTQLKEKITNPGSAIARTAARIALAVSLVIGAGGLNTGIIRSSIKPTCKQSA